ncbi:MAG TPA: hypothetical protein VFK02_20760 [Kofleriaceae bacterium]|nr:hypothetical protein [Kofleriaceae bacterium]
MHRISFFLILVAACNGEGRSSPPSGRPTSASAATQPPALEHASQADLAREIAEADRLGTWSDVQQRWRGQTVRWTVTRWLPLCHAAEDCNVAAFPIQRPAKQGWMPAVSFAPGQYEELDRACGSQPQCDVTIEGTLSKLEVSPELPTALQLSNVRVIPAGKLQTART